MRLRANNIECGDVRTVVEVWDCLQDMTIGVEMFWPADATREVPARVQDDLGIDKVARGDPVVQSLAERNGGGHVCVCSETGAFSGLSYLYDQRPQKAWQRLGRFREVLTNTWAQMIWG